ncbi:MAG: metal-dependent transcriptional regulator [Armatimonadetes bacterium]|nr:metal-dependent transcriptional regulator [Armatimonadota bacterium]
MSESTEMYLLTIYKLNLEHGRAGNSQMAQRLGVSTASITEMVKKLAEKGLVERKGRGLYLRPKGEKIALKVLRKHRLAERLLTDHLKIPWDQAHEQSCRLEHILADNVVDALDDFLGHPATCPHGHPIPDREGTMAIQEAPPLSEFRDGSRVEVVRVSEESLEVLRYLDEIGLKPGRQLLIEKVAPFEGPLLIRIDDASLPLSRAIARKVWVKPAG